MDNLKALYSKVTQLHQAIDKKYYELDHATNSSYEHGVAGDQSRASSEAVTALRHLREIEDMEARVIDAGRQIVVIEQHLSRLQQQNVAIREDNIHHATYINDDAKHKLDDIGRQTKALRG